MNSNIANSVTKNRKEIPSLYVLKAFCAFGVVLIHTNFLGKDFFIPICRMAVPLFFMISGYFMVSDTGDISVNHLWRTVKKIFRINIVATAVYLLYFVSLSTLQYIVTGNTNYMDVFFPDHFWSKLILSNPYAEVLWYLVAYMEALLVIIFSIKFNFFSYLQKFFPLFFVFGLLIGTYNFWLPIDDICYHRNFMTMALPFIMLGSWIKQHLYELLDVFKQKMYLIVLVFLIIAYSEYYMLLFYDREGRGDYWFSIILLSFCFFVLFLRFPNFGKGTIWVSIGKYLSLFIYLYHVLVHEIFCLIMSKLGFFSLLYKYEFLIVLSFTIVLSAIIYRIKKMIRVTDAGPASLIRLK